MRHDILVLVVGDLQAQINPVAPALGSSYLGGVPVAIEELFGRRKLLRTSIKGW